MAVSYVPGITSAAATQLIENLSTLKSGLPDNQIEILAGVVRPTFSAGTNTWDWINDSGHTQMGFGAPSVNATQLILPFTKTYSKILSFIVVPDETMASYGVQVGSSVATNQAVLSLYSGSQTAYFVADGTSNSNAFTTTTTGWSASYAQATGAITLTHPPCFGLGFSAMPRYTDGAGSVIGRNNMFMFGNSPNATTFNLFLVDPATNTVRTGATNALDKFTITRAGNNYLFNPQTTNFGAGSNFWVMAVLMV